MMLALLVFVQLDRQIVGILHKGEAAAGELVGADWFGRDAEQSEAREFRVEVADAEREVAQTLGLRARGARWWIGEGEEFDLDAIGEGEIEFVGVAVGAVIFGDDAEAEGLDVEAAGARVVGADDGEVVEAEEGHNESLSEHRQELLRDVIERKAVAFVTAFPRF